MTNFSFQELDLEGISKAKYDFKRVFAIMPDLKTRRWVHCREDGYAKWVGPVDFSEERSPNVSKHYAGIVSFRGERAYFMFNSVEDNERFKNEFESKRRVFRLRTRRAIRDRRVLETYQKRKGSHGIKTGQYPLI